MRDPKLFRGLPQRLSSYRLAIAILFVFSVVGTLSMRAQTPVWGEFYHGNDGDVIVLDKMNATNDDPWYWNQNTFLRIRAWNMNRSTKNCIQLFFWIDDWDNYTVQYADGIGPKPGNWTLVKPTVNGNYWYIASEWMNKCCIDYGTTWISYGYQSVEWVCPYSSYGVDSDNPTDTYEGDWDQSSMIYNFSDCNITVDYGEGGNIYVEISTPTTLVATIGKKLTSNNVFIPLTSNLEYENNTGASEDAYLLMGGTGTGNDTKVYDAKVVLNWTDKTGSFTLADINTDESYLRQGDTEIEWTAVTGTVTETSDGIFQLNATITGADGVNYSIVSTYTHCPKPEEFTGGKMAAFSVYNDDDELSTGTSRFNDASDWYYTNMNNFWVIEAQNNTRSTYNYIKLYFWTNTRNTNLHLYPDGVRGPAPGTYSIQAPQVVNTGTYGWDTYYAWYVNSQYYGNCVIGLTYDSYWGYCQASSYLYPSPNGTRVNMNNAYIVVSEGKGGHIYIEIWVVPEGGTNPVLAVTINEPVNAGVVTHQLTAYHIGKGTVEFPTNDCDYEEGEQIILTPTPETGWIFDGWEGDCADQLTDNGNGTYTFTMGTADCSVTARFINQRLVTDHIDTCSNELPFVWRGWHNGGILISSASQTGIKDTTYHDFDPTLIDSVVTLELVVHQAYIGEQAIELEQQTLCQNELDNFAWNGHTLPATFSGDTVLYDTVATAYLCDSVTALPLHVYPSTYDIIRRDICADHLKEGTDSLKEPIQFFTKMVYAVPPTTVYDTLTTEDGCWAIKELNLTVTPNDTLTRDTVFICQFPYTWPRNGQTYNTYEEALHAAIVTPGDPCDVYSAVLVPITAQITVMPTEVVEQCIDGKETPIHLDGDDAGGGDPQDANISARRNAPEGYTWVGHEHLGILTESGEYFDTVRSVLGGCDSVYYSLQLTLHETYEVTDPITICENELPYTWTVGNQNIVISTPADTIGQQVTLQTIHGCDSVVRLCMTINPIGRADLGTIYINEGEQYKVFEGTADEQTYTTSASYTATGHTTLGCDSTVTFTLVVLDNVENITVTICDNELPYLWKGQSCETADTYRFDTLTVHQTDSIIILTLNVLPTYNVQDGTTICQSALPYTWEGEVFTEADTRTLTLTSSNGCDSTVTFTLNVLPTYDIQDGVTICESALPYTWETETFTAAGTKTLTLTTEAGCDSVVTFTLNVLPTYNIQDGATVCTSALPYTWETETFTAADTRTLTLTSSTGCDSTVTFTLTVLEAYTGITDGETICESELPYTWQGEVFTSSDTRTLRLTSSSGCDSTVTFTLTVLPTFNTQDGATICQSELPYTWEGETFTAADTKTKTLQAANGCDSTVTFTLTVLPTYTIQDGTTICESELPYTWETETFTAAGTRTLTLRASNGCDSTVTFTLTTIAAYTGTDGTTICANELPYTWETETFTAAGTKTLTLTSSNGCDSTVTFTLNVLPTYTGITDGTTICESELPYTWQGEIFTAAGTKTKTLTSSIGCDSTVTFTLTVLPTYTVQDEATICESGLPYTWQGQVFTAAGSKTLTLQTKDGCDSVVTFTLRVQKATTQHQTDEVCDNQLPYLWQTYRTRSVSAQGSYRDTLRSRLGCDSIIYTLDLTVYTERLAGSATMPQETCANDEQLTITYTYTAGMPTTYDLTFTPQAAAQGFSSVIGASLPANGLITIPLPQDADSTRYVRPDDYQLTLSVHDRCGYITDYPLTFRILYPSWLIQQRWHDVLALYNQNYNGGYTFSDIRWYMNGTEVLGQGEHHSYIYTTPRLNEATYYALLTRTDDGKIIRTCDFVPNLNSPYYAAEKKTIDLLPAAQHDTRHIVVNTPLSGEYKVYDVTGKWLMSGMFGPQYGNPTIVFSPSAADGTYMIHFRAEDGTNETKKWLIR